RDFHVTGVQTCALPIFRRRLEGRGPGPPGSPRQLGQQVEFAGDQRLLLGSTPTFQLSLGRNCVTDLLELLSKHQPYRAAVFSPAIVGAEIVLRQAPLQRAYGRADVVAAVGAEEDVGVSDHRSEARNPRASRRGLRPSSA